MKMETRKDTVSSLAICRLCLTKNRPLTDLYQPTKKQKPKNSISLSLKILTCISVEVFPSDKMPAYICQRCEFFIDTFFTFKQICRKADETILNFIRNGNPLEPISWPATLTQMSKCPESKSSSVVKTIVEGGATVEVMSQDATDSEDDDENTYNVKIGDGEEDTACIKVVTSKEQTKGKKCGKGDSEDEAQMPATSMEVSKPVRVQDGCWACDQCESTYPLQQLLELHKMQKHRARSVSCDQCDAKFFNKYDLTAHMIRHSDEMPFDCAACDRSFKRLVLLRRHERLMHSDLPMQKCQLCPASFLSIEALQNHRKKHVDFESRSYACDQCDKKFRTNHSLERHKEVVHMTRPEFSCEYCPEHFGSLAKLTRHVRTHAGERPYPCKYCDKAFTKSHHYTRHVRLKHPKQEQIEVEVYRCEQCTDTFGTQDELIYHSAIHATQNLTCPLCQEKFDDVDAVTAHIKSHVNGMEFMCDLCELVFTSKEKLDSHIVLAHDEELNNQEPDESSMDMEAEDDEDESTINVKVDGHCIEVEVKKQDDFLLPNTRSELEDKMDTTNSEESESEATFTELSTVNTLTMMHKESPMKTAVVTLIAEPALKPTEPKSDVATITKTAPILRKAEEIKQKLKSPENVADKKEKPVSKVESSSSAGASDKSLRLLEKELQELQRTNTRSEAKIPAKPVESRARRSQVHTSTPKPRTIEEKKTPVNKPPVVEKKVLERRAVKENKEPKEKEQKPNNGSAKDDSKNNNGKDKEEKETKTTKEEQTTKDKINKNGGNDKNNTEESVRRSSRPSKIKDYAKMIRDRTEPDSDDTEDDDEEYVETEKTAEARGKPRRGSLKQQKIIKPATPGQTPIPPRKRGRPRKDAQDIPSKIRKEDTEEEQERQAENEGTETSPESTSDKSVTKESKTDATPSKVNTEKPQTPTSTEQQKLPQAPQIKTSPGPTLKKVTAKSLPPGVKPLPLPPNARPMGAGELCEMQIGQKMVKVQKIVMTKAEVEVMAKKGLVEMKDGTMVLKPGIKLASDPTALKTAKMSAEAAKESPAKKEKAAPTRCDMEDVA